MCKAFKEKVGRQVGGGWLLAKWIGRLRTLMGGLVRRMVSLATGLNLASCQFGLVLLHGAKK